MNSLDFDSSFACLIDLKFCWRTNLGIYPILWLNLFLILVVKDDVFSWLSGVWKLLDKSFGNWKIYNYYLNILALKVVAKMLTRVEKLIWISLHLRCLLKCLEEYRNWFELPNCVKSLVFYVSKCHRYMKVI